MVTCTAPPALFDWSLSATVVDLGEGFAIVRVEARNGLFGALVPADIRVTCGAYVSETDVVSEALQFYAVSFHGLVGGVVDECVRLKIALTGLPANQGSAE